MKKILLLFLPLLMLGCKEEDRTEEPMPIVGKYVYQDYYRVVHIDRECDKIFRGVSRIPSDELKGFHRYCSKCVNDEAYEILTK